MKKKLILAFLIILSLVVYITYCPTKKSLNDLALEKLSKQSIKRQDKNSYSFAVLGDNKFADAPYKKLLRLISKDHKNTFIINTGDVVTPGLCPQFLHYYQISNIKLPLLTVIGNHERDLDQSGKNYKKLIGKTYYSFTFNNDLFIILDDSQYKIDKKQFRWLEEKLKQGRKYNDHLFVFMHVPPFDPTNSKDKIIPKLRKDSAQKLLNLLGKYKPTAVFAGHYHNFYQTARQGVLFVITGGAGAPSTVDGLDYQAHPFINHFVEVQVIKNSSKINIKRVNISTIKGTQFLIVRMIYDIGLSLFYILITTWPLLLFWIITIFIYKIKQIK